jgi:hypothetical protein
LAIIKGLSSRATPQKIVTYLTKEEKTEKKLISGKDCSPGSIVQEFRATKELYDKIGGVQYHHMIQSFSPKDNITPKKAHKLGIELAEKQFKGHEVFIVTHKDKEHIHNHLVINSVSFEDGKKYQSNRISMIELKRASNRQCAREGLITLDLDHRAAERISTGEKRIEMKGGTTWKDELRQCIDFSKEKANSFEEFKESLKKNFEIDIRITNKTISYQHPEKLKPIRGSKLGTNYDKEELENGFIRKSKGIERERSEGADQSRGNTSEEYREERSRKANVDWSGVESNVKNEGNRLSEQFGNDVTGAIQRKVRDIKERTDRATGISKPKDRAIKNEQRDDKRSAQPGACEPNTKYAARDKKPNKKIRKRNIDFER